MLQTFEATCLPKRDLLGCLRGGLLGRRPFALKLRALHASLKMADALHVATAQYHGCQSFWTNDSSLQKVVGNYAIDVIGV